VCHVLKFSFSEKSTKIWKNLPPVLTLLSKNSCFVKTSGRFFLILWPSHNVLTLTVICLGNFPLLCIPYKIQIQKSKFNLKLLMTINCLATRRLARVCTAKDFQVLCCVVFIHRIQVYILLVLVVFWQSVCMKRI
jgi:hypothetical protein